jgi:hypothetical protein
VFPEMGEPRRWFVQVTEKIDAAHGLVANARLRTAANVNPATPAPAINQLRFLLNQSCGLDAVARSQNVPRAP